MVQYDRNFERHSAPAPSSSARQRSAPADSPRAAPAGLAPQNVARRFDELAARWREETELDSAPTSIFQHPAYREILGFGPAVLPLMFADLASHGSFWFGALRDLTGEDPVPPEDRGRIARMREHWLAWGRTRGYLDG